MFFPAPNARIRFISGVSVRFNEALDPEQLDLSETKFVYLGEDGELGGKDDLDLLPQSLRLSQSGGNLFVIPPEEIDFLPAGVYQFQLNAGAVSDRAGNELVEPFKLNFTKGDVSRPLIFGETISDAIVTPGEDEIYAFTGIAGQRLYLDGLDQISNINARLISPDGTNLFSTSLTTDRGPFSLERSGTYRLIIEGTNGSTGDYQFRLLSEESIPELTQYINHFGTLNPARKNDLFKFEGQAGEKLTLDTFNNNSISDIWFSLIGSNNESIFSRVTFDQDITLPGDGSYILVVGGFGSDPLNYAFRMFPVNTTFTPLTLNQTITDEVRTIGKNLVYSFNGSTDQRLYFDGDIRTVSHSIPTSNIRVLQILSPSGENILPASILTSENSDPFTLPETGTYQLVLGEQSDIGFYQFRILEAIPLPTSFSLLLRDGFVSSRESRLFSIDNIDDQKLYLNVTASSPEVTFKLFGANNLLIDSQIATPQESQILGGDFTSQDGPYILVIEGRGAYEFQMIRPEELELGVVRRSSTSAPGRVDEFYTFETIEEQLIYFDANGGDPNLETQIFSPAGVELFSSDVTMDSAINLIEKGTYLLTITGDSEQTELYNFELVDITSSIRPAILQIGRGIESSTTFPGRVFDSYTFEVTEEQLIYHDARGGDPNLKVQIFSPHGVELLNSDVTTDSVVSLSDIGTYLLSISGSGEDTEKYNFELINIIHKSTEIFPGSSRGRILSQGFADLYRFEGTVGQSIEIQGLGENPNGEIVLFAPDGQFITSINLTESKAISLEFDGTYILAVEGKEDDVVSYLLKLL